ncbi:uncharacterized protein LOC105638090 [Jatropha curcas]|uniref:Myb-related protein 123 n=1 Tax=Jatropha curcas TaxID=180498 RepID=G9B6Q4_JATCU|nr:uncharacterized protein LOC105638090 [Jatropha curcas]AEI73171.1 R2R3 MYB transcription factor [Jatropha curcas]
MGRSPCCSKEGLNRGAWTALEDKILHAYIKAHGEGKWRNLPKRAGLKRCGKSCRLRWLNYLRPDIKRGNISHDEEELIVRLHKLLGNRWSLIAGRLPGRTDNEIKNYWNTTLGKKANAQSNSPQFKQTPSTKKMLAYTEPNSSTKPSKSQKPTQVIHTKANRCTKVFIPLQSSPPLLPEIHNTTPTALNQPPEIKIFDCPSQLIQYCGSNEEHYSNYDLDFMNIDRHDQFEGSDNNEDVGLVMNNYGHDSLSHYQFLPSLEEEPRPPTINDEWATTSVCLGDDDNINLDLDSFGFLLDSEEWP